MSRDVQIFFKYLALFGLRPDFNQAELVRAYYTLAKLNHPDLNKDHSSETRMVIINKGYSYLKDFFEKNSFPEEIALKNQIYDEVYILYREAFDIMKMAFEAYFGENFSKELEDMGLLRERLKKSKLLFARIVKSKEYNHWISDSIDKINSINKWL